MNLLISKKVVVSATAAAIAVLTFATKASSIPPPSPLIVGGYLPEYRSYIDLNAASQLLTDVILFSIVPKADGTVYGPGVCCLDTTHYEKGRKAREYGGSSDSKNLRLFVSVGGAGRSNSFATIASDRDRRTTLVKNLIDLCKKEGLQGVDFDWEYPQTQQQLISYVHLLLEASDAFHKSNLLVSVALSPGQTLTKQVYDAVDRINLMTYDMVTSTGPGSHHANLEAAKRAVDRLLPGGCPSGKILLGIPAYARHQDNPGMVKTYSEIIDAAIEKQSVAVPDMNNIIRDVGNNFEGYAFDSPADVKRKVDYARTAGLGGIFFWEIGQDSFRDELVKGGVLLQAASVAAGLVTTKGGDADDVYNAHTGMQTPNSNEGGEL